ncbi:MAG: hypothetical protein FWC65_02425 [Treponema sp.]|nr:hypothetical protein [Treponema sp.]
MRLGSFFVLMFLALPLFYGCQRGGQEAPIMPPATHPLTRHYIGYGVVNASFTHFMSEPGPGGVPGGHLRRGTVLRIIERHHIAGQGAGQSWVLAEGIDAPLAAPVRGWLQETLVEIFDRQSRAVTASRAMGL